LAVSRRLRWFPDCFDRSLGCLLLIAFHLHEYGPRLTANQG